MQANVLSRVLMRTFFVVSLCVAVGQPALFAGELKIQPAKVTLTGPHASQRLLVIAEDNGQVIGEWTPQAKFTSANAAVATVDGSGIVRAAGDGETTITAAVGGKQTTVKVSVRKTKES